MSIPSTDSAAIRQVIRALRGAGHHLVAVDDGGEEIKVATETAALEAITSVDEAHLYVTLPDGRNGWIFFVLGNDPDEVVCDHSTNLSPTIDALIDSWA